MSRIEVKLTGFGGQGIVLSGIILARAAMHDEKGVVQTQSYGPEARGGACRSEVVISDETIHYPLIEEADILVAMSQEALDKHISSIKKGGMLIIDSDTVSRIPEKSEVEVNRVASTGIASEKLGKVIVANIVMLGALMSLTGIVSKVAMEKAVKESVPRGTEEINLRALEEGYLHAQKSRIKGLKGKTESKEKEGK
ncbi:MAG: 2-oxoacid:acceptor oxidoreductase family protein [Candidatus Aerophobetes bacterium]|nr:2-oxoacid:acceptor oxidoreductase family protein [Candidatus Aerophobetes bacterium]